MLSKETYMNKDVKKLKNKETYIKYKGQHIKCKVMEEYIPC